MLIPANPAITENHKSPGLTNRQTRIRAKYTADSEIKGMSNAGNFLLIKYELCNVTTALMKRAVKFIECSHCIVGPYTF